MDVYKNPSLAQRFPMKSRCESFLNPCPLTTRIQALIRMVRWAVGMGLVLLGVEAAPPKPGTTGASGVSGTADPVVSVYLMLDLEPAFGATSASASTVDAHRERGRRVLEQHAGLRPRIEAGGGVVTGELVRLVNAFRVRVPSSRLASMRMLPGVVSIEPATTYVPQMDRTIPFLRVPAIWSGQIPGYSGGTGKGIRIGIIDTGIDYTHADFGGSGRVEDYEAQLMDPTRVLPGAFPTAKVVGGFDFVGDDYDSNDPKRAVPRPDPNPIDIEGHGSHVAGIAAGMGVLTNGSTFMGSYTNELDSKSFSIGPGVAPEASLYALKVFDRASNATECTAEAIEWASDPNGDFDPEDRLDILNLSLGSRYGMLGTRRPDQEALDRLSLLGCVVAVSAMNNGDSFYILGSPSQADRVLSVANSIPAGRKAAGIRVVSPSSIAGVKVAPEASFARPIAKVGVLEGPLVAAEPIGACGPLSNPEQVRGAIALVQRGICTFLEKAQQAFDAGAVGVVIMNNVPGEPFAPPGSAKLPIPVVMVSQADGLAMQDALGAGEVVTLRMEASIVLELTELTDRISSSSSRGPGSPDGQLKPDIAAPGHDILSAKAGGGVQGIALTGTSMAAPVIAGAAALMRQAHPDWSTVEIKAALMNTSTTMRDANGNAYAESRVGAGRVRPDLAVGTSLLAYAEDDSGRVSVSFGALLVTNTYRETRRIRVVNHGVQDADLDVSVVATVQRSGFSLSPKAPKVRVPARGSATVEVDLTVDPSRLDVSLDPATESRLGGKARTYPNEASGLIRFSNAQGTVQVPYYAQVRAGSDWQGTLRTIRPAASTYSQEWVDVSLGFQGSSAHTNPVVSVFELGTTSLPIYDSDFVARSGDLLAVGAATDGAVVADPSKATLYFGLVTAGPWTMPTPVRLRMEVAIDTDGDEEPEFVVQNGNSGSPDVLETTITPTGGDPKAGLPLNVEPPDRLDTATLNNSVLVLPIQASSIGLEPGKTAFRYRVRTYRPLFNNRAPEGSLIDGTDWIAFDAARPIVDAVRHSPSRTPLLTDGKALQVRLDRSAALASKVVLPGVLLLHHFNPLGRRHEVVRIDDSGYQPVAILSGGVGLAGNPARFEFRYSGPVGQPLVVERSRNLVAWEVVQTGQFTGAPTLFISPQPTEDIPAFYRVRIP